MDDMSQIIRTAVEATIATPRIATGLPGEVLPPGTNTIRANATAAAIAQLKWIAQREVEELERQYPGLKNPFAVQPTGQSLLAPKIRAAIITTNNERTF